MKLSRVGEFGLIERIRKAAHKGRGVRVGIGDDAAWLDCLGRTLLVTTDLLIEGVHFDLRWISFYALGYKTLAVNLSDIAAMGGTPAFLTLSLGIPADFESEDIEEFYRGIRDLAARSGVSLVGGDTSAAERFFISAALIGHSPRRPVLRSGARAGDDLYITGTLGDSALGLDLLKKKKVSPKSKRGPAAYLIRRHHFPSARLKAGARLARAGLAKAMIDVSDGLVQDLGHLCKASGVGAEVWADALPLSPAYRTLAGAKRAYALSGGEDYELLFAARPEDSRKLEKIRRQLGSRITRIGKCRAAARGIGVFDGRGRSVPVPRMGYDHFKGKS
jgi:thiamine-monophosphate kinase